MTRLILVGSVMPNPTDATIRRRAAEIHAAMYSDALQALGVVHPIFPRAINDVSYYVYALEVPTHPWNTPAIIREIENQMGRNLHYFRTLTINDTPESDTLDLDRASPVLATTN